MTLCVLPHPPAFPCHPPAFPCHPRVCGDLENIVHKGLDSRFRGNDITSSDWNTRDLFGQLSIITNLD